MLLLCPPNVGRGTLSQTRTPVLGFTFYGRSVQDGAQKIVKYRQTQPKKPRTSVPPPQAARIAGRFISGESIRKISREEHRDRETVKNIVQGPDVQEYILVLRAEFFGVGADAVDAVRHQLKEGKDGRLGLEVLRDVGAVPSKRELYEITHRNKLGRGNAGTDPKSD